MKKKRKITVRVPEKDLRIAQEYTGAGITATVIAALEQIVASRSARERASGQSRGPLPSADQPSNGE